MTLDLPGMYKCISLDPPWPERGGGKSKRGADRHFPVMSVDSIMQTVTAAEPYGSVAPDAHCWCWVTDNYLRGGLKLLDVMGFRYVRTLVWVKVKPPRNWMMDSRWLMDTAETDDEAWEALDDLLSIGLGQYLRGAHELCLFGVRGNAMVPEPPNRMPSVVFAPKGRHSEKPDAAIKVFEAVSPGPRIEMFARTARPGWDAWGNEAPGGKQWATVRGKRG